MTGAWTLLATLLLLAVSAAAQAPAPAISEHLALENDTVRVTLLTLPPGAASGRHSGLEPELGMVIEGELTLVTDAGLEVPVEGLEKTAVKLSNEVTRKAVVGSFGCPEARQEAEFPATRR